MSCLYSSPEFTNLGKLLTLHCRCHGVVVMVASPDQAAHITRTESPRRFNSRQILPYVAVNKDAFPSSPACAAGRIKSFRLPKQAQVSCVSFQAQYQAFVRFCGRKRRSSLKPSRPIGPAFWNLSLGAGSRFENSGLHPQYPYGESTEPATLDRCCERNVVAPGEYSKCFFCIPIGHYGGNFRPATARWTPARSALGGFCSVNPAAVISSPISPLWPWPASTTRTPPCASRRAACGIS